MFGVVMIDSFLAYAATGKAAISMARRPKWDPFIALCEISVG